MKKERLPRPTHERLPSPEAPSRRNPSPALQLTVGTWLEDGRAQGFSQRTLKDRRGVFNRFRWWLEHEDQGPITLEALTPDRIRRFLAYCREPRPEGRFGCDHPVAKGPARPSTVHTYYRDLRAFCRFCMAEGLLVVDPLRNIKAPRVPKDQVQPFTQEQVQSLLDATRRTAAPERNRALVMVLIDSGMRASECCSLRTRDVRGETGEIVVTGKGSKRRSVYLGTAARRALRQYLTRERVDAPLDAPLFVGERGNKPGTALTPSGIRSVFYDCERIAGITGVRCSPHTARHTFAVAFLRGGGNVFELQRLLGHTDLAMVRRYVALAEADLAQAHRLASPADRMGLR